MEVFFQAACGDDDALRDLGAAATKVPQGIIITTCSLKENFHLWHTTQQNWPYMAYVNIATSITENVWNWLSLWQNVNHINKSPLESSFCADHYAQCVFVHGVHVCRWNVLSYVLWVECNFVTTVIDIKQNFRTSVESSFCTKNNGTIPSLIFHSHTYM